VGDRHYCFDRVYHFPNGNGREATHSMNDPVVLSAGMPAFRLIEVSE
jgi:hypothetical protein